MNLVTGSNGLVGSHLILRLLQQGETVRALKRPSSDFTYFQNVFHHYAEDARALMERIDWVEGDITDTGSLEEAMDGVEHIYHCAAVISFLPVDLKKMLRVNEEGTANVVNAALVKGAKKLCHVSSIAALGRPEKHTGILDEGLQWISSANNSGYGISKHGAEIEVFRGIAEGLDAVIVNPSIILGIADPEKGSSKLFTTAWKGLKFYPTGRNGFVDVNDVVSAMITLTKSDITGERFVLNGANISYRDLFTMIARSLGTDPPKYKAGPFLASLAWRGAALMSWIKGTRPLLTRQTARTSQNKYQYSSAKIRQETGFQFTGFEETISTLGAYYKETLGQGQ